MLLKFGEALQITQLRVLILANVGRQSGVDVVLCKPQYPGRGTQRTKRCPMTVEIYSAFIERIAINNPHRKSSTNLA